MTNKEKPTGAGQPPAGAGATNTTRTLQEHAIDYARRGLAVLPLKPRDKMPIHAAGGQGGFHQATTNPDQIRAWWSQHPNANIGARPPAGCIILDVDPGNGGATTWAATVPDGYQPEHHTFTTRTGSGGWHAWYLLPFDRPTRSTAGDGIDLRTHRNGHVVMPPSIHPTTGQAYQLQGNHWPPAPLPKYWWPRVYKPIETPRYTSPARRAAMIQRAPEVIENVRRAPNGERNRTLFVAACRLFENGLDALGPELFDAARDIGLGEREIQATLNSAAQRVRHTQGRAA
ncbi:MULTISPECIES: bifunctional DNA primase/polymerase [unclassified Corynebacterium]|uniref:bifunctional DNA primase/polymerase n=1 Tax=unclassified Corynebacterium TaxID=2624378 RepID=UPI00330747A3